MADPGNQKAHKDLERYFAEGKDSISILIAGKMWTGKSTLVNGIVGKEVARVSSKALTETTQIVSYDTQAEIHHELLRKKIKVVVWDTPGLGDPFGDDEATAKEIAEKCKETDLLVYCLDIRGRLTNDDATGIDLLTKALQPQLWRHAIFALTHANDVHAQPGKVNVKEDVQELNKKLQVWRNAIKCRMERLNIPHDIANDIVVVPTGYRNYQPPGCEDWLSTFWAASFSKAKWSALPLLGINVGRLSGAQEPGAVSAEKAQQPSRQSFSDLLIGLKAGRPLGAVVGGAIRLVGRQW